MNIDFSISNKYYTPLYSNLIIGSRHIGLAFTKQVDIPVVERIKHFVLGIFEYIPVVGHLISAIDRKKSHIRVLVLNQKTPYERGYAHGELYRKEIQSLYKIVKQKIESIMEMGCPDPLFIEAQQKVQERFKKFCKPNSKLNFGEAVSSYFYKITISLIELEDSKEIFETFKNDINKILDSYSIEGQISVVKNSFKFSMSSQPIQIDREKQIKKLENKLGEDIKNKMKGIAKGAGVKYDDVVLVNTFINFFPGRFGCSALASVIDGNNTERLATTNHFVSKWDKGERLDKLNNVKIKGTLTAQIKALQEVSEPKTIQSIVFDVNKRMFHLSTSNNNASNKRYSEFSNIFQNKSSKFGRNKIMLSRNLDWNWSIGPQTIVLVEDGVASITWPGFICSLSGMNQHGLSLAACSAGNSINENGDSVPHLLFEVLKTAMTVQGAINLLEKKHPACSINLTLAGTDGIARVELDPKRKKDGVAHVEFLNIGLATVEKI